MILISVVSVSAARLLSPLCTVRYSSAGGDILARAEGDLPGPAVLPAGQRVLAPDAGALLLDLCPGLQSQTGARGPSSPRHLRPNF